MKAMLSYIENIWNMCVFLHKYQLPHTRFLFVGLFFLVLLGGWLVGCFYLGQDVLSCSLDTLEGFLRLNSLNPLNPTLRCHLGSSDSHEPKDKVH